jgi:hypothetical protein
MKSRRMSAILVLALGLMACSAMVAKAEQMGTAFTYQGFLIDGKKPADGLYDLQFSLYDDLNAGSQQGYTIDVNDHNVIDGQFTVELDFGDGIFTGEKRWLETTVRRGNSGDPCDFITLEPRLELTLSPYAVYAKTVGTVPETIASAVVPKGGIIMWSGAISDIPSGWALCDGDNNTPDLTSRFIRSVPNGATDPCSTGGFATHDHGSESYIVSSHTHSAPSGTHKHPFRAVVSNAGGIDPAWSDTESSAPGTGVTGDGGDAVTGRSTDENHLPPYYELAFIMKL